MPTLFLHLHKGAEPMPRLQFLEGVKSSTPLQLQVRAMPPSFFSLSRGSQAYGPHPSLEWSQN